MMHERNDRNFDYPRDRDPRDMGPRAHNSTSRHLVNNYDDNVELMRSEGREKDKDRYMPASQGQLQPQSSRRDRERDDYSPPHRSTNRRVLNAM